MVQAETTPDPVSTVQGVVNTQFAWGRIETRADYLLPFGVTLAVLVFVVVFYRRDTRELFTPIAVLLATLRVIVFLGLMILYLQPTWRTTVQRTRPSRVLMLADTSSSMGLIDASLEPGKTSDSRSAVVAQLLQGDSLLPLLRRKHEVSVLAFDASVRPVADLEQLPMPSDASAEDVEPSTDTKQNTPEPPALEWAKLLRASGHETRLGQALRRTLAEVRGGPISGLIVLTDGCQNAGPGLEEAITLATESRIPVFPVGFGTDQVPINVRVYKLDVLPRVHPGDPYSVSGLIQGQGPADRLAGRPVTVELLQRAGGGANREPGTGAVVASKEVLLGEDGESVPVTFELTAEAIGRKTLCLRVVPITGDQNAEDNLREVDVEVVDRKDHVLLFSGGPGREYRFLRTTLSRDKTMTVDVRLQTAKGEVSQDADAILDEFPATRAAMHEYDCVVAIDPDWTRLTAEKTRLLESWTAEQGGGLIVVAGPVQMGEPFTSWLQDDAMGKIRGLYPVEFDRRASALQRRGYASKKPWRIDFTREGLEAEYLWLGETETASRDVWGKFEGVHAYYPVRGPKPAAVVLARFGDPQAADRGEQPVYMAEQFYGAGRVFYLGSAEMWRLRRLKEAHFDRLYTRLIRHVAQGRLLRQSDRGVLLVGQENVALGSTVVVRARLLDAQLEPLEAATVALQIVRPDGGVQTATMRGDPGRVGTFVGQLSVLQEGVYWLELAIPESEKRIVKRIQVALPDSERRNTRRNDKVLFKLGNATGGKYYHHPAETFGAGDQEALVDQLVDRSKTITLAATPDPEWERWWMQWVMVGLCGVVCLEWLVRRLCRLA